MGQNQEHRLDVEFGSHVEESSGDAGACLTRHVSAYKEDNSCSHRWQGFRAAKEDAATYDWPAYESLAEHPYRNEIRTVRQRGQVGRFKVPPQEGAWDLDATTNYYGNQVPNFRSRADIPYYHNAHHVIPNSVLNGAMYDAAASDMRVFALARKALLDAKYNLNHKGNMVLLPMSKYVAAALHLPRHIAGVETEPGQVPEHVNHSAYNAKIRAKVKDVIGDFASQVKFQQHDVDAPEIAKVLLEDISREVLTQLKTWGSVAEGRSLNEFN